MIERGSPDRKLFGLFSYIPKLRQNCSQVLWYNLNTKLRNKSKFIKNFDIKKAIKETLTDSKSIVSLNTNGRKGFIFIKNFGEKIGTDGGKSLNRMKVVIDEYGKVVTAYPIK